MNAKVGVGLDFMLFTQMQIPLPSKKPYHSSCIQGTDTGMCNLNLFSVLVPSKSELYPSAKSYRLNFKTFWASVAPAMSYYLMPMPIIVLCVIVLTYS